MSASSSVLKRLSALNRSGRLAKPLQYAHVKAILVEVGEDTVLHILDQLDQQAEEVDDPADFVTSAAQSVGGASVGQPPMPKRVAGPGHSKGGPGMIARRLGSLNASQRLQQPIDLSRVEGPLSSLGMGKAMTILQGLEDAAEDILDPTAYIRTAVLGAGGLVPDEDEEVEEEAEEEEQGNEEDEQNWYVQAEPDDELEEVEVEVEDPPQRSAPSRPAKGEGKHRQNVKVEPGHRAWFAKTEDLTEAERIERRVNWLNRNAGLAIPIDLEILPALESIGFQQSMRVLRRLEENAGATPDPNSFIRDLVGRSGWIWGKPDVIDEDTKVAKRVAWLNQFGCLNKPIEWAEVADVLDGLKVAHAMVLLRELEMQGRKVLDPTEYIKRTAELAGGDDIELPALGADSVTQRIEELNSSGMLGGKIDGTLSAGLQSLGEEEAMKLLQEVADKGSSVKDPSGYVRFKLKARLASKGLSLEEGQGDAGMKILKRVEWLNDYGGLVQDIDYSKVSAALEKVGVDHAMTLLKQLEDQRQGVQNPTAFILNSLRSSAKRAGNAISAADDDAPRPPAAAPPSRAITGKEPTSPLQALNDFMAFLHKRGLKHVRLSEVANALDALGTDRVMRILREMKERGLGLDDPVSYIKAAAQRSSSKVKTEPSYEEPDDADDVSKRTSRIKWLNQFAGLTQPVNIDEVIGALYCLGVPQSMTILRSLQERGSSATDPTRFIKSAVQQANTAGLVEEEDEDAEEDEQAEEELPEEEGADGAGEEWEEIEEEQDGWEADGTDELDLGGWEAEEGEEEEDEAVPPPAKKAKMRATDESSARKEEERRNMPRRVVGGITGYKQLVPSRATSKRSYEGRVKQEPKVEEEEEEEGEEPDEAAVPKEPSSPPKKKGSFLPFTPQEKMVQVRDYAKKNGLYLDDGCLKAMARLPFYRAKELIEEVLLGGRKRQGVSNPSRYLTLAVQKMSVGLGVEQGILMELAVSLGVVLNNDCLDELASIPRQDSHSIVRELSKNPEVRSDPMRYIRTEVLKCRAQKDARPFGKSSGP